MTSIDPTTAAASRDAPTVVASSHTVVAIVSNALSEGAHQRPGQAEHQLPGPVVAHHAHQQPRPAAGGQNARIDAGLLGCDAAEAARQGGQAAPLGYGTAAHPDADVGREHVRDELGDDAAHVAAQRRR
ncbi:hypothetical protein [Streptomonospora salina]|uniref:Uncharacterized protein n=1 Tax=Streptomonospora salina TaxID=104205 RepID=A0A841EBD9_9ACTN|nr:hypothetical protein [Streptomonospora salina]MBB5998649.1 hypothetical protein [Streptomonospora salina]